MGSPVSNSSWKPSHGRGEEVEKLALETFTDTPIWWKRFVDAEPSPESFFNKSALRLFRGSWNSKIWPKLCLFVVFHISTWEVGTLFGDAKPNRGGETVDDTFVIMEKSKLSELFVFLGGLSLGVFWTYWSSTHQIAPYCQQSILNQLIQIETSTLGQDIPYNISNQWSTPFSNGLKNFFPQSRTWTSKWNIGNGLSCWIFTPNNWFKTKRINNTIFWVYIWSYFTVHNWLGRDIKTNSGETSCTNYLQICN